MTEMVSIIIPAYNVENYIRRCLDSILSQSYTNLEIIVIDDGSADSTLSIIEEYSNRDKRIRAIKKENSGVSATRNLGLHTATGKYICFFDSDDFMNVEHISSLVESFNKEENTDCAVNGYSLYSQKERRITKHVIGTEGRFTGNELIERLIFHRGNENLITGVNNKLYSAKIIRDFGLRLDETVSYGEDWLFNIIYYSHCRFVSIQNNATSNYVQYDEERLSTRFNPKGLSMAIYVRKKILNIFPDLISITVYSRQLLDLKDLFAAKYIRNHGLKGFADYCNTIMDSYDADTLATITKTVDVSTLRQRDQSLLNKQRKTFLYQMTCYCIFDMAKHVIKKIVGRR